MRPVAMGPDASPIIGAFGAAFEGLFHASGPAFGQGNGIARHTACLMPCFTGAGAKSMPVKRLSPDVALRGCLQDNS
jgi:hypothetical protein